LAVHGLAAGVEHIHDKAGISVRESQVPPIAHGAVVGHTAPVWVARDASAIPSSVTSFSLVADTNHEPFEPEDLTFDISEKCHHRSLRGRRFTALSLNAPR